MFNQYHAYQFCREPFDRIEGFAEAFESEESYEIHHRFEEMSLSFKDLIALGMYYRRPACELIFLKKSVHRSLHNRLRYADEEFCSSRRAASKRAWADPERRYQQFLRSVASHNTPELRERMSEVTKLRWTDPEYREQHVEALRQAHSRPEARLAMWQACVRRWMQDGAHQQQSKATELSWKDPEIRKKRSEGIRRALANPEVLAIRTSKIKAAKAVKAAAYQAYKQLGALWVFTSFTELIKPLATNNVYVLIGVCTFGT